MGGITFIAFVYISFMTCFCIARPNEPNNVVLGKMIAIEESNAKTITEPNQFSKEITGKGVDTKTSIGPETYLCEITDFYELVILLLSTAIFIILGLIFVFVIRTSKFEAIEKAKEALDHPLFKEELNRLIGKCLADATTKGDIGEIFTNVTERLGEIEQIKARLDLLEKTETKESYELNEADGTKENGDNKKAKF